MQAGSPCNSFDERRGPKACQKKGATAGLSSSCARIVANALFHQAADRVGWHFYTLQVFSTGDSNLAKSSRGEGYLLNIGQRPGKTRKKGGQSTFSGGFLGGGRAARLPGQTTLGPRQRSSVLGDVTLARIASLEVALLVLSRGAIVTRSVSEGTGCDRVRPSLTLRVTMAICRRKGHGSKRGRVPLPGRPGTDRRLVRCFAQRYPTPF